MNTNLAFEEWIEVFGCERVTGALLDWLTHWCQIPGANGESYRLRQAGKRLPWKLSTKAGLKSGGTPRQDRQLDRIPQIHIFITEASRLSTNPASLLLQPFHFGMGGKGL